jgi:hypothetical protein
LVVGSQQYSIPNVETSFSHRDHIDFVALRRFDDFLIPTQYGLANRDHVIANHLVLRVASFSF